MKRALAFLMVTLTVSCQMESDDAEGELLKWERSFATAVLTNDADAIGKFLADDWVIVDADGGIIDKARFLGAIKSGTLVHEEMEVDDVTVRAYGDSAVLTAITSTSGKYMGQEFSARERATDVFVREGGQWRCRFSQLTRFNPKATPK